ncbi:MAG: DEAD/DEAH box helicase family protein [Clostridia bacterium]|nr:DEAD/DEAH box helicase family protein [Clostridia bacterium]
MSDQGNGGTGAKKQGGKELKSIRFNNAFNFSEAKTSLGERKNYNADVQQWNKYAEALDRYDTFAEMLIDTEAYRQTTVEENGERFTYGIHYDPNFVHDTDDVILSHQKTSSHEFLKTLRGFGLLADIVGSGKTFEAGVVLSELAVRGFISSMLVIVPKDVYGAWVAVLEKCFGLGKCVKDEDGNWKQQADGEEATLVRLGRSLKGNLFNRANKEGFVTPKAPMIVTMEDFVHWTSEDVERKLFDVVVVDEAHNLNNGEGDNARAMALLSRLMETKRSAKKTYCLLLSATPHSGNLEDMFRLWYFVRCKGGSPKDFDPKAKNKSEDYEKEREFYFMSICRNATTVRDFVRKEKISTVRGDRAEFCQAFYAYVSANYKTERGVSKTLKELTKDELPVALDAFLLKHLKGKGYCDVKEIRRYVLKHADESVGKAVTEIRDAFETFLAERAKDETDAGKRLDYEKFDYCYEGRKEEIIDEFLNKNAGYRDEVRKAIAGLYHNGVLRPIMIRQPDEKVKRTSKKRTVVNLMFFRTDAKPKDEITLDFTNRNAGKALVRLQTDSVDYLNEPNAITVLDEKGEVVSQGFGGGKLEHSYVDYITTKKNVSYGAFFKQFMQAFGHTDVNVETDEKSGKYPYRFHYEGSLNFYEDQMWDINRENKISKIHYNFLPVYDQDIKKIDKQIEADGGRTDEKSLEKGRTFYLKYNKLKDILRLHSTERVIVFFDYLLGEEYTVSGAVYEMLLNDPEFSSRVLNFSEIDGLDEKEKTKLTDKFNEKSDAILVVKDKGLTEGTNFQACSVVVNFQITTDPLSMQQSIGRVFRIGQKNDVLIYSLTEAYQLEGYLLAYYSRIGLMSSDTGDAEILAGCNNDDMVTLLCPNHECNHLVLKTKADCEQITLRALNGKTPAGDKKEYIVECQECKNKLRSGQKPYKMIQLITSDVKCDKCGAKVLRTEKEDGVPTYSCVAGEATMATRLGANGGKQEYYCDKYCAMSKCRRLDRLNCKAVQLYRMKNRQAPEIKAEACSSCEHLAECKAMGCIFENGPDSVLKCRDCQYSGCGVKPHAITFNADWEADCPKCGKGTLKPEKTKSFSTYIQKLFQLGKLNKGKAFCERFGATIDEVVQVKEILSTDDKKE